MKKLSNAALMELIEALWEERSERIRNGVLYSAFLAAAMFVLWYMTRISGGAAGWFAAGWALAQVGIIAHTVLAVLEIDNLAEEAVANSHAFGAFFRE